MEILNYFPDSFTPNTSQVKLLKNIEQAFEDGYKFVVCSAPTGSGKSFISKTLGNISNGPTKEFRELVNSYQIYKKSSAGGYQYDNEDVEPFGAYALTITKALQDQYKEIFDDTKILKGKSNYQCSYDTNYSVECAPCVHIPKIKEQCWVKDSCPYYTARNEAVLATFGALNYNMFFALPDHVKKKQYLICDEASELEDQLVKEFTCSITFDALKKAEITVRPFPTTDDYGKAKIWINNIHTSIEERIEELKDIIANSTNKKKFVKTNEFINELVMLKGLSSKIQTLTDTWHESEYLFERTERGINFIPLKVNKLSKHLFNFGEKIILMSATIIDPETFCKTLGIEKYKYIEAESTFDPKKAPIYVRSKTKLNFNNLATQMPTIAKLVRDICEFHKNEKGIVHTHSNNITGYIKRALSTDSRYLFREPGVRNEHILDIHYNTEDPTVLISPSMLHGVDLKDDLARFQIIVKAPYLPMKDIRVEKLSKESFVWYQNKMISSFIQACGRGVRSHKDHCVTYVMDGAIIEAVINNKKKIPKYFIDRFA